MKYAWAKSFTSTIAAFPDPPPVTGRAGRENQQGFFRAYTFSQRSTFPPHRPAIQGTTKFTKRKNAGRKEYVGSQTCEKCHKIQYESWKETYHSKMVRKPAEGILKAVVEKWATDGATPGPATGNVTGKPFKMEDVVYVIGSNWKQRFLVKDDTTGGDQFLDKQFNRMSGTWEKYGNKNDCLAVVGIVQAFAHVPQADSTVFPNNNRK